MLIKDVQPIDQHIHFLSNLQRIFFERALRHDLDAIDVHHNIQVVAAKDNIFYDTFLRRTDEPLRFAARKLHKFRSQHRMIRTLDPVKSTKPVIRIYNRRPSDKLCHKRCVRCLVDLHRRAHLLDASVVRDNDLIRDLDRLILIMRDKNACDAKLCHHLLEPRPKFRPDFRIDRRKRLIEKQYLRIRCKCAGKSHSLPLSSGQLIRIAFLKSRQSCKFQQFGHAFFYFFLWDFCKFQAKCDIVKHGHVTEQRVTLEHKPDSAFRRRNIIDTLTVNVNVSGVRILQPGDHAKKRCLAAAGWSEQCNQFAFFDAETYVIRGFKVPIIFTDISHFHIHSVYLFNVVFGFSYFDTQRCCEG